MTARARWILLLGITGVIVGINRYQHTLAFMSLTVVLWLGVQWLMFYGRLWFEIPKLRVNRVINGLAEPPGRLWAGRRIKVETTITTTAETFGPVIRFRDCLPDNMQIEDGHATLTILSSTDSVSMRYSARIHGAGHLRLPGLRLTVSDAMGFFETHQFLAHEQNFKVMPSFVSVGEIQPVVKRVNSIPLHGIHRLQRTGLGSELLELREYAPGDPPKSIAWKASARRQSLMTRQYESEVPVRIRLFVDGSISTRTGGYGRRLIDQQTFVAASIARSAINAGDPVGATLFDERGQRRIPAGGGERTFYRLLDALSEFVDNPNPPQQKMSRILLAAGLRLAGERFPELLDPRVNLVPFTFLPLSPWKRSTQYQRTVMANVLAERYALTPHQIIELVHDDVLLSEYTQRFLVDSGSAWMYPLIPYRDRGFHDGIATMELLGKALTDSVATAKDNEVYVVMANLLECSTNISQLLPAVRTALARHHRVVFVVPTPNFRRPDYSVADQLPIDPAGLLDVAEDIRTRELHNRLNTSLRRIGAKVALSGDPSTIQLVVSETELTRMGRSSRAGASR